MDGVDDNILVPSMTYDRIIIDTQYQYDNSIIRYIVQNNNALARIQTNNSLFVAGGYTASGFNLTERHILHLTLTSSITNTNRFFARTDASTNHLKGNIYDIKIYNGVTLHAHYDMTTGTVQDQSGNNRHAELTGGTWITVDDGPPDDDEPPLKNCVSLENWETSGGEAVILIDEIPPESASNIRVTHLEQTSLLLHWTESISPDVKDYQIYNGSALIATVVATVSKLQPLSYQVTGLTPATSHVFTIVARDYSNNESHGVSSNIRTHGIYALSMNGSSDFVKLPLLTFDTVEVTCHIMHNGRGSTLMDARAGISTAFYGLNSSGNITHSTSLFKDGGYILYDDEPAYNINDAIGKKLTITLKLNIVGTDDINIFSRYTNNEFMQGKLYAVRILKGDHLVAAYNFTEQFAGSSVLDISGNGHTATLTGGTWVME